MSRTFGLLCFLASAVGSPAAYPDPDTWPAFKIHVLWAKNSAPIAAAAGQVRAQFCKDFSVNCTVAPIPGKPPEKLSVFEDFGVLVPRSMLAGVLPWFLQHRITGIAGGDLELRVVPVVAWPPVERHDFEDDFLSLFSPQGPRHLLNTNAMVPPGIGGDHARTEARAIPQNRVVENTSWALTCSSDCDCYEPYAPGSVSCTGWNSPRVDGFHIHMFFPNNDANSAAGYTKLHEMMQARFNMPSEVCADNTGHEQDQDKLCFLAGPGGKEGEYPQNSSRSSFVTETHSVWLPKRNFTDVAAWILLNRHVSLPSGDVVSADFLLHPLFGCNFADHVLWSLHAGSDWPINFDGVAGEGGYFGETPTALDPAGGSYPWPLPPTQCGKVSDAKHWSVTSIYDSSDPNSTAVNTLFFKTLANELAAAGATGTITEYGDSWRDPSAGTAWMGPATQMVFPSEALPVVLPFVMAQRTAIGGNDFYVTLASHRGGGGCEFDDQRRGSMYAGPSTAPAWPLNPSAASAGRARSLHLTRPSGPVRNATCTRCLHTSDCPSYAFCPPFGPCCFNHSTASPKATQLPPPVVSPRGGAPAAYLLFYATPPNNGWGGAAMSNFTKLFADSFNAPAGGCVASGLDFPATLTPDYGSAGPCLFAFGSAAAQFPYMNAADPWPVSYGGVWIPSADLARTLVWIMEHRVAEVVGYDLDLRLVALPPKESTPTALREAYVEQALRAGTNWRLKQQPFE